jgi:drug/metabolite transporter (DMT)-like permease
MSDGTNRLQASAMLVLATVFWAVSFPTMKALALAQQQLLPGSSTWLFAALCVACRFGAAAVLMLLWCARTLNRLTRLEVWQGAVLGGFGSAGLLLQMDGLAYTSASTSAFLTQCYALLIPLWVARADRRWPSAVVMASCLMVVAGVAVLSKIDWQTLRLGRGEMETLASSVMFTGQILWLQRPVFSRNNANHFSLVMFTVMALCPLPVVGLTAQQPADCLRAYSSGATLGMLAVLVLPCTLGGYLLMNHWQPRVSATQAGLIYCVEPVFASLTALFVPAWLSRWADISYANERVGINLLTGGGLITAANILIQVHQAAGGQTGAAAQDDRSPER